MVVGKINSKTKILIGILIIGIVLIGGWFILNECQKCHDLSQTDSNTISKNNPEILSAVFVVLLFIGGYLLYKLLKEKR